MGSKNQSSRKSFHNGPFWIPLANELDFYWLIPRLKQMQNLHRKFINK